MSRGQRGASPGGAPAWCLAGEAVLAGGISGVTSRSAALGDTVSLPLIGRAAQGACAARRGNEYSCHSTSVGRALSGRVSPDPVAP